MGLFSTIKPSNPSPKETPKPTPPPAPEKPKDTSIYGGRSSVSQKEIIEWMKRHPNEIYEGTKHRIGKKEITKYGRGLFPDKYGTRIENKEPGKIRREIDKKLRGTGSFPERERIKQDRGIINRIIGSGKRKNN